MTPPRKTKSSASPAKKKVPQSPTPPATDAAREFLREALRKQAAGEHLTIRAERAVRGHERLARETARTEALSALPQKELMEVLGGISRKLLRDWETGEGFPRGRRSGSRILYDLYRVVPWLRSHIEERARRAQAGPASDRSDIRTKRDLLAYRRELGELVDRSLAVECMRRICAEIVSGLQDIDARAAVRLGGCRDAAARRALLETEHRRLCARVARRIKEAF